MRRIGTKFGGAKKRGRRQVVWTFKCPICKTEVDVLAKRRPTMNPEDEPENPVCTHGTPELTSGERMENQGMFFLTVKDGKKTREPATELRIKWEAMRVQYLRGRMCECGHAWWEHRFSISNGRIVDTTPGECKKCTCQEFRWKQYEAQHDLLTHGKGTEVPF